MPNKLENSRILVIGASGFIGSSLVKEILKEPSETRKRNLETYEKGMSDNKTRFEK